MISCGGRRERISVEIRRQELAAKRGESRLELHCSSLLLIALDSPLQHKPTCGNSNQSLCGEKYTWRFIWVNRAMGLMLLLVSASRFPPTKMRGDTR